MKQKEIYLNLKRFDIPRSLDGINDVGFKNDYAKNIVLGIEKQELNIPITIFFQEAHLLNALDNKKKVNIGCQGVYALDVSKGKNFGAFTTLRTAKAMEALGVSDVLIGHCEERNYLNGLVNRFNGSYDINIYLNEEIKRAIEANMKVLFCVGEKAEEQDKKYEVIKNQLLVGLKDVDLTKVAVAYEPLWAIGPGKTPPGKEYIDDIAKFIKSIVDVKVIYGGGLKEENAKMIASIDSVDGGLIALTRFGKDFGFYLEDFERIVKTYKGEM